MPVDERYRRQVNLLVQIIPLIAPETCFALKGGTGINLFVRDMPRLSVDIDLTYIPVKERAASLNEIDAAMRRIEARIAGGIAGARVTADRLQEQNCTNKLFPRVGNVQVKIEVTPVLRGCVYEPKSRPVSDRVQDAFGFAEMQVVSFADLYAGKIVAALERQHPRDLFDVRDLLANEGIDDELRRAFIVYLLSQNRPLTEVLAPTRIDISEEFVRGFNGMTETPVELDELLKAREALISNIVGQMPMDHRKFLLAFEGGAPDWSLLGLRAAKELPAVKWRLHNLAQVAPAKKKGLIAKLAEVLQTTT